MQRKNDIRNPVAYYRFRKKKQKSFRDSVFNASRAFLKDYCYYGFKMKKNKKSP